MDDKKDPYDIEPDQNPEPEQDPRPAIDAEGLLEDFDEDADFEEDPQVQAARAGSSAAPASRAPSPARTAHDPSYDEPRDHRPLSRPGAGPWRLWGVIGVIEVIVAVVLTIIYAPDHNVPRALLTLYNALLHTGTGVAGVLVAAMILERPFGSVELAASRMLAAVGAFVLVFSIPIALTKTSIEELIFAAVAYVIVVAATFRLAGRTLMIVVGAHFLLWLIVQIGMLLTLWTSA